MQYSSIFLALLAASGAIAAPQARADNKVNVILGGLSGTGSQTTFREPSNSVKGKPEQSGPFKTVEIKLGAGVKNQALRCQILDDNNKPIVAVRGANTDITFADAGKGPWTLKTPSKVSAIVCDQAFKSLGAAGTEIRIVLSNQAIELGSQTVFADNGKVQTKDFGKPFGPFQTVELRLGPLVDPLLRCQITDSNNKAITVIRGENVKQTFGDGDKGEWTLQKATEIKSIVCDPSFK